MYCNMASRVAYISTFELMIWGAPAISEELHFYLELENSHDPYAMAVKKAIGREDMVVGHVPCTENIHAQLVHCS